VQLQAQGGASVRDDLVKTKTALEEHKEQITALREDNARKAKLLSALKTAKTAEATAVEQWRAEAQQQEEAVKRLQRAMTSKEQIVKDLRSKLEAATAKVPSPLLCCNFLLLYNCIFTLH
jgi:chromosome segregation ATPase